MYTYMNRNIVVGIVVFLIIAIVLAVTLGVLGSRGMLKKKQKRGRRVNQVNQVHREPSVSGPILSQYPVAPIPTTKKEYSRTLNVWVETLGDVRYNIFAFSNQNKWEFRANPKFIAAAIEFSKRMIKLSPYVEKPRVEDSIVKALQEHKNVIGTREGNELLVYLVTEVGLPVPPLLQKPYTFRATLPD